MTTAVTSGRVDGLQDRVAEPAQLALGEAARGHAPDLVGEEEQRARDDRGRLPEPPLARRDGDASPRCLVSLARGPLEAHQAFG